MCRWLNLPRSSYYYKTSEPVSEADLEEKVKQIFSRANRDTVPERSSNVWLQMGLSYLVAAIRRIMKRLNLVSVYQQASFKPYAKGKNEAPIPNLLDRQFYQENHWK